MKASRVAACVSLIVMSFGVARAQSKVDIYTANELRNMGQELAKERKPFANRDLARYSNHYTMLAARESTGSSELHEHEADLFVVENGAATIITGGKILNAHTQKAGEVRGTSIEGGERHLLRAGDILHIPAGVPHQLLVEKAPFDYFVLKVTGQ
jgi:mannose-6-phosphate isomerase-like protein (cupin superfamily)